jgi:hypothetical protein
MHADLAIERDRASTDQRRQLTRRAPSRQIHLEEAVLAVQKAGCTRQVDTIRRAYGGYPETVARDFYWRRQPGDPTLTVELRQAGSQFGTRPECATGHRNSHEDECEETRAAEPFERRATRTRGRINGLAGLHFPIVARGRAEGQPTVMKGLFSAVLERHRDDKLRCTSQDVGYSLSWITAANGG